MDYLGGFQYQDNVLKHFPTAEGYVSHVSGSYQYVFNYTDHLGNIRLSYGWDTAEARLKIMEENHYYPFGMKHANYNTHTLSAMKKEESNEMTLKAVAAPSSPKPVMGYNYKYNGKEYQDELGLNLYDYGARNYDAAIGRWMNIDPLAEKFTHMSPYNYGMNNPIYFIDPDGMASDGWIRRDDNGQTSMTYDPNVNNVNEANTAGYTKVVSVSETAKISSTSGSYSYDLNADGSVTNSSDGSNITFHKPIVTEGGATVGGAFQTGQGTKIYTSNTGPKVYPFPLERGNIESMDFSSPFFPAGIVLNSAGRAVTSADGFLFGSLTFKTPINIPVQRFGNMSYSRPDFWGLQVGTSKFVNRRFVAIKPEWNSLTQYTSGVIPKGTTINAGIVGPQGLRYPGGSLQFIVNSNSVINQSSSIIP